MNRRERVYAAIKRHKGRLRGIDPVNMSVDVRDAQIEDHKTRLEKAKKAGETVSVRLLTDRINLLMDLNIQAHMNQKVAK